MQAHDNEEYPSLSLPAGIWYEPERKRFRIRLYLNRKVVFRAYRNTKEEALIALALGKKKREQIKHKPPVSYNVNSAMGLVRSALAATR